MGLFCPHVHDISMTYPWHVPDIPHILHCPGTAWWRSGWTETRMTSPAANLSTTFWPGPKRKIPWWRCQGICIWQLRCNRLDGNMKTIPPEMSRETYGNVRIPVHGGDMFTLRSSTIHIYKNFHHFSPMFSTYVPRHFQSFSQSFSQWNNPSETWSWQVMRCSCMIRNLALGFGIRLSTSEPRFFFRQGSMGSTGEIYL